MSINLGIYDFFAYIIPGLLYLFVLNEFSRNIGLKFVDFLTWLQPGQAPNAIFVLPILVIAYVMGHIFDVLAYQFYLEFIYRLRHKKKVSEKQLQYLKERYPNLDIQFESKDWNIMFTFLRGRNVEIARIIDKYQADSIMLRNIALGMLILALIYIGIFFSAGSWTSLFYAGSTFLASLFAIKKSNRFRTWFYSGIFEASLEYGKSLKEVAEYNISKNSIQITKRKAKPANRE